MLATALGLLAVLPSVTPAMAAPPQIRSSAANPVPACVTPDRLMAFLRARNPSLDPAFSQIASFYKTHGETWRVRWDYAFFQMLLETNYLMFRRGDGRKGDVALKQYNFAGLGATGGGVPGDHFPDVGTGVLAQIHHLVVYSGERVPMPVARRTREKQDDILAASLKLRRPVTFADLTNRWAADRNYARSIETVATLFKDGHCKGRRDEAEDRGASGVPREPAKRADAKPVQAAMAVPAPAKVAPPRTQIEQPAEPDASLAIAPVPEIAAPAPQADGGSPACKVLTASYGGTRSVLIRAETQAGTELTVLTVLPGFEASMSERFIQTRAPSGALVGTFESREEALARAREQCPGV